MTKPSRVSRVRSCALKSFTNNLSDINRNLSFYVFISSQFLRQNTEKIEASPNELTTIAFADNRFAEQFNVKLNQLSTVTEKTDRFIFDSIFLYCCFELDNYFKETYKNIQKVEAYFKSKGEQLDMFPTKIPELTTQESLNQIKDNLAVEYDVEFSEYDYLTFEYFRLRRNTIAHRDIEKRYTGSMQDFVQKNGNLLNEYWSKTSTVIKSFDFANTNLEFSDKDEIVSVINILRDTVPKLEEKIVNKVTEDEWIEFLFEEFKKEVSSYDVNVEEKFIRSFNKFVQIKLNRNFTSDLIKKVILE